MGTMGECTVYKTADIIGKKWSLLIILSIYKQKKPRFNEIKRELKEITSKMLSERLKDLESENIIKRTVESGIPLKTYYELTPSGKGLIKIIDDIKSWGLKWKFKNNECSSTLCRQCIIGIKNN